jgi:membrane protease YdiL (CAAX protease family)
MNTVRDALVRHPILSYLVIAFAFSWAFTALVSVSVVFGLIALFGPAVAAIVVSRAEGTLGVLWQRIKEWRLPFSWYIAAFALPFAVAAVGRAVHVLTNADALGFGTISAIEVVIFVLVIGEEIGWRGFLQPRFRARMGLLAAGLATGLAWTFWHLPIYLQPTTGLSAFLVFAWWVLPLAVVMGFVAERTRYSVLVATVLHGAANIATPILLPDVDVMWTRIVTGTIYALVAAGLVIWDLSHRRVTVRPETAII